MKMAKKKTTTDQNKMSKKKMNQNSHPMLKNKMMMKGNDHDIAMDSVKGLISFLEFSLKMVYVWCKQMLKIEVKRIFENFSEKGVGEG